jgi:hypothetical protein
MEKALRGQDPVNMRAALPAIIAVCAIVGGCAWWNKDGVIFESPGGSVFLEPVPTRGATAMYRPAIKSIQTSHPVRLDPETLAQALRGVQVRDRVSPAQVSKAERVFSDEEVAFLAPQLSAALSQATSDQRVRFRVVPPATAGSGATEGTLHVDGPLLHLTVTEYRHADLDKREIAFVPESARHPEAERKSQGLFGAGSSATLAIAYNLLSQPSASELTPAPAAPEKAAQVPPAPVSPPRPPLGDSLNQEELRALKDHILKKDMENEALKEEVKALRQKLAEQEAELKKAKKRKGKKDQPQGKP